MIGIYHSKDFDGVCSGAIMKLRFPEIKLIGYDYGEPFPWEKVEGQDVIMADVSLPMPDMAKLAKESKSFLWIDHHASAIKDFTAYAPIKNLTPFVNTLLSACELCWKYFFPDKEIPLIVEYLGRYDRWDKSDTEFFNSVLMPFQYGMRSEYSLDPDEFQSELFEPITPKIIAVKPLEGAYKIGLKSFLQLWAQSGILLAEPVFESVDPRVGKLIEIGRSILKYQAKQDTLVASQRSFEGTVDGLPAIFCNGVPHNSQSFHSVYDPDKHKLMVAFHYDGKQFNISLYSTHDDVDCGAIAKLYGGGGHKGAAGFKRDLIHITDFLQRHEL